MIDLDLLPPYTCRPPFAATAGSRSPKVLLLGEAWGGNEADYGKPFVGEAGKELWRMLGEAWPDVWPEEHARVAGLHRYGSAWIAHREDWLCAAGIAMTNVLAFQPPGNNLETLCARKSDFKSLAIDAKSYPFPAFSKGKYLHPRYFDEIARLAEEIAVLKPNLMVCLGNTACWAVLLATNIGTIRGAITEGVREGVGPGVKCLPTYHPAGVLRNWAWRPIVIADLRKAQYELEFPEIRRPCRSILIDPTIEEVEAWTEETLSQPERFPMLSIDTETEGGSVTHFGIARSRSEALVVPFLDRGKPGWSYWLSPVHEERALRCCARLLIGSATQQRLGQNFLYDLQYTMPLGLAGYTTHDLMLLHHSLFPEIQKGLGFLGSVHANEAAWKPMRHWKADTEKRDE